MWAHTAPQPCWITARLLERGEKEEHRGAGSLLQLSVPRAHNAWVSFLEPEHRNKTLSATSPPATRGKMLNASCAPKVLCIYLVLGTMF